MSDIDQHELDRTGAHVQAAVRDRTPGVDVAHEGASLEAIQRRLAVARHRQVLRRKVAGGLAAIAAITLVALALPSLVGDGDRQRLRTTDPGGVSTSTTAAVPSTTATSITSAPADPGSGAEAAFWPPSGRPPLTDALAATRSFAEEYVGLADPPIGALRPGPDPSTAEVDVLQRGENGAVVPGRVRSTVALRRAGEGWVVTGARTDEIVVDHPKPLDTVQSVVVVDGRARGFEGNVVVRVRDAEGTRAGELVGVATAGCCETLEPFHLELEITRPPSGATGSLLVHNGGGSEDVGSFAVIPVRFAPAPAERPQVSDEATVRVWLVNGTGEPESVPRTVQKSSGVLRMAVRQLLAGPTGAEAEAGFSSAVAAEAGAVPFTVVMQGGRAVVDFGAALPQASPGTSAAEASARFLRQLHATVFQFPTVTEAEYWVGGSCDAFWAWLQRGCTVVDRTVTGA